MFHRSVRNQHLIHHPDDRCEHRLLYGRECGELDSDSGNGAPRTDYRCILDLALEAEIDGVTHGRDLDRDTTSDQLGRPIVRERDPESGLRDIGDLARSRFDGGLTLKAVHTSPIGRLARRSAVLHVAHSPLPGDALRDAPNGPLRRRPQRDNVAHPHVFRSTNPPLRSPRKGTAIALQRRTRDERPRTAASRSSLAPSPSCRDHRPGHVGRGMGSGVVETARRSASA